MRKILISFCVAGFMFFLASMFGSLTMETKVYEFRWDLLFMFWAGTLHVLLVKDL